MSGWVLTGRKGWRGGQYVLLIRQMSGWVLIYQCGWRGGQHPHYSGWFGGCLDGRSGMGGGDWSVVMKKWAESALWIWCLYWLNSGNRDWGGRHPHDGGWVLIDQCWWAGGQHPNYDGWVDEYWLNNGDGDWGSILIVGGWMDASRMGSDWSAGGGTN